jgi:hypothetical protein
VADGLALTQAEEILRCQIEIGNDEALVERNYRNAESAKDTVRTRRLACARAACGGSG